MKHFPNGFTSWSETHYEVVYRITMEQSSPRVNKAQSERGHGGLYELAEELTDKFELMTADRDWDGEFFDEIEDFLNKELNQY